MINGDFLEELRWFFVSILWKWNKEIIFVERQTVVAICFEEKIHTVFTRLNAALEQTPHPSRRVRRLFENCKGKKYTFKFPNVDHKPDHFCSISAKKWDIRTFIKHVSVLSNI